VVVGFTTHHPTDNSNDPNLLLWYKKKYSPKDNLKLLGGWMRPRSFSSIVETDGDPTI
jgi:hypothetical protein